MSEINSFSDYTNKYNSNVDYSALFGGTSNSSSLGGTNILSDYASIKNGSYGKLLKAYYAKQDAEKTAGTGDTSQKLTLMKTSADSLKKSADALNASSLWKKKKIKKKDEETGQVCSTWNWEKWRHRYKRRMEAVNMRARTKHFLRVTVCFCSRKWQKSPMSSIRFLLKKHKMNIMCTCSTK